MSVSTVTIPDSLYERLRQLAQQQQITVDQFVASAVAEKLAAVETEGFSRSDRTISKPAVIRHVGQE